MDRHSLALLTEPDPDGHFMRGTYYQMGKLMPIPRDGGSFLLDKPLWKIPVPFADNEVTKMKLFGELKKIWVELKSE